MGDKKYFMLVILLILSVVINLSAFNRISEVERAVNNINREEVNFNSNEYNHLTSQINSISHSLNQLRESEKWIISEEFHPDIDNSTPEEIFLDITWSFRELEIDSEVYMEYSSDSRDWVQVEADKVSASSYLASLNLDPEKTYKYRFVASGEMHKSSDEKIIPHHYYRLRPARTASMYSGSSSDMSGISNFGMELVQEKPLFDFFTLQKAYLDIVYMDGDKETIELTKGKLSKKRHSEVEMSPVGSFDSHVIEIQEKAITGYGEVQVFSAEKTFDKEVESIALRVIYKNGTVHEGELWPNEIYHQNIHI